MIDLHTHHRGRSRAIINLAPGEWPEAGYSYSAGVHPWETASLSSTEVTARLAEVERLAALPEVVAVGEAGLDRLRGATLAGQTDVLVRQIELSERAGKPLILHVVKAFAEIMALRRRMKPAQPWIIHGFRGKPQLARQLLHGGFSLSLGERFNPDTAAVIPPDRLFAETDESLLPIEEIAARLPVAPGGKLALR